MAKTLYFTNTAAPTHRGNNDAKLNSTASWWLPWAMSEVRGSGVVSITAATVLGPTNGLEATSGGSPVEFITEPLSADFTISGTITLNLWAFEATMNDNAAANAVIEKLDGATGALTQIAKTANATEVAVTTAAVNNFTVTPTSTACKRGDRLRLRIFADDAGTMAAAGTFTATVNGTSSGASGDSWVQFTENLTFELGPGTLNQPDHSTAWGFGGTTLSQQVAQSFVARGTLLTQVAGFFQAVGGPTDNLVVEIQSDSAGNPSGTVIGTVATVAASSLPAAVSQPFAWTTAISLADGATYWVVFRRSGALNGGAFYNTLVSAAAVGGWTPLKGLDSGVWTAKTPSAAIAVTLPESVPTYYLTDTASSVNPGSAVEKVASQTRGGSSVNSVTNTAAGPTAGIQATGSAGGTAIEWYTPALNVFTLGGKAKFNIRALESNASANASLKAEIAIVNGDGTSPVVWGIAGIEATAGGELGTADAAVVAWVAGDDTAITAGQRLRFRLYVDDSATNPLATAFTATVSYNGATASAAGDTYVVLPVAVTEQSTGPTTWNSSAAVALIDALTTSAVRDTFSSATAGLADTVTASGTRETLGAAVVALTGTVTTNGLVAALVAGSAAVAVTASVATAGTRAAVSASTTSANVTVTTAGLRDAVSSAIVALTDAVATAGTRTTFSTSTVPLTVLVTTSSIPGAFGSSSVALTGTVTTAGTKEAVAAAAVQLTGTVTTDGVSETGAQTYTSAATVALTATVTTTGARTAVSTSQVTQTVLVATSATRDTFSTTATTETVTIITSAVPGAVGQTTVQLAATVSTAGLRTAVTTSTTNLAVVVATAGTRVTSSSSTVPLTATVTTAGSRVVYGDIGTVSEHVAVVTDSRRDALTTSTVALHVTITTSAETLVPLPPGWISTTTTGRILAARQGSIDHPDQGDLAGTTAGRIAKVS